MDKSIINSRTLTLVNTYLNNPGQAVGLVGQKWLNKNLIAIDLAERLLSLNLGSLTNYPYYRHLGNEDTVKITIDEVRSLSDFLILKVPIKQKIARIIIIENADRLTIEAQNALLKNIEEPPKNTVFILTFESITSLLSTITSRLHIINVYKPGEKEIKDYYISKGYHQTDIDQSYLISDGLPRLMELLLTTKNNPINEALTTAKQLLSSTTFERLNRINELAKNKKELNNLFFVIKQMAKIGLSSNDPRNALKWKIILRETIDSEEKLKTNVQTKLLLTNYVLSLN
jgi:DNA polymerase III delta prime subunit